MRITKLLLVLLICFTIGTAAAQQETLQYFYLNACESCTPEENFAEEFYRLTGQDLSGHEVVFHNVYHAKGRAAYDQATAGWSDADKQLPLLIMDGKGYAGTSSIARGLESHFGTAARDNRSVVYFLTATACNSCANASKTVEQHPAIVPVEVDGQLVSSNVEVQEINLSADPAAAMALFELYQVPDRQRKAPLILMGATVLAGEDAIREEFLPLLRSGAALNTPRFEAGESSAVSGDDTLSLVGAALAGITAGLNPCALSMLLVMMGILLSMRRSVLGNGLIYLAGKLVVYLLIGLGFARLWTLYAPSWLPLVVRVVVTVIGAVLIVLNLMDAFHARAEQYGSIRNQLPAVLRGKIRQRIQQNLTRPGKALGLSALALGMLVAAGEFLCAGQVYVAVLMANAGRGTTLPLIIYSIAFLLPSAAMLVLVAGARRTMDASDWLLKRMPVIKLLTAAVMAVVLIYAWVVK